LDQKPTLIQDDARLLPRFRAGGELLERHRLSRLQAAALAEGTAGRDTAPAGPREQRSVKAEPGDLRGIPVIGCGVGGVSPGTSPESAISRVDRERAKLRRVVIDDGPREPMVAYG
jgi:hypothetical protein